MATTNQDKDTNKDVPSVLVHTTTSIPIDSQFQNQLTQHFKLLIPLNSPEVPLDTYLTLHAQSVRVLLCFALAPVTSHMLSLLPNLQLVAGSSAGVDHVDLAECKRRGILVTNAGPAFAEDAADFAVALLFDVLRKVSAGDRFVRSGLWGANNQECSIGSKIGGKQVGIVGMGNIGTEVAKRLVAFGCSIAYSSRKKKPSLSFPYYAGVRELAANTDVLIVCCSLTEETRHIINKEVMMALGKEGVLVNVGRGAIVDEKELVKSLMEGEIGGAGLDVFENEPDVPKELFSLDNVVLSPHRAVLTPESFAAVKKLIIANIQAFFLNKPLLSVVQI